MIHNIVFRRAVGFVNTSSKCSPSFQPPLGGLCAQKVLLISRGPYIDFTRAGKGHRCYMGDG